MTSKVKRDLVKYVKLRMVDWMGHKERMNEQEIPRKVLDRALLTILIVNVKKKKYILNY